MNKTTTRREFLRLMGAAAAGLVAAGCRTAGFRTPGVVATLPPTPTPFMGVSPLQTPVSPSAGRSAQVAIAQAADYEPGRVRQQLGLMFDALGGLSDVVRPGDRVAVKVNLTGGTRFTSLAGIPAIESYVTHPQIVRTLGELLRDAGARELLIVESAYDQESYRLFGYEEVASALDATLIDLNMPHPYTDFASLPVGEGWFIYDHFIVNRALEEVDAFVSVAKMKCHFECGVTLSMKNLIGLVPVKQYRLDGTHWWRSALHGQAHETKGRLPRVILDLNRARPIHLAVIDGIKTAEGGEVPRGSFNPVEPGVLVAGKNFVATDAVATAVMGFDPTVEPPAAPFLRGDNHLNMAHRLGLGTNRLEEIQLLGAPIEEVLYKFRPSTEM